MLTIAGSMGKVLSLEERASITPPSESQKEPPIMASTTGPTNGIFADPLPFLPAGVTALPADNATVTL